ncbi:MAG: PKD domain-containing protein [Halolamina sp.]
MYAGGDGQLRTVAPDGTIHNIGVQAELAGRMADLDSDGTPETPFVDGNATLRLAEPDGTTTELATGAASSKSAIAVGDFDGDGTKAVFYPNVSDSNYIYKVEVGESPNEPVRVTATASNGIAGVGDLDGDDDPELAFAGSSSTIKYLDNGTVNSTGYSSIGSNNGYGMGGVADVDGDGVARVTLVDGSNNIVLVGAEGTTETVPNVSAAKSPISSADWTGDGSLEILYRDTDGKLAYTTLGGDHKRIRDADGNNINAKPGVGVAARLGPAGPDIGNFTATNPTDRNIRVSLSSDKRLETIEVSVDGPDAGTLGTADFSVTGDGPYTYTATYSATADGEYNATLTTAVGPDGNDGADGQNATVTVETSDPIVQNATIRDAQDSDGIVGGGHTVFVSVEVPGIAPENVTVEANATAFAAGVIELSHATNATWTAQFTVDGDAVPADGEQSLAVTATNQYGNNATNTTGTLVVDTTPPNADAGPDVTIDADTRVTFDGDGTTDRTDIVSYHWEFGDGSWKRGNTATYRYGETGTYIVTLTVTDEAGNTATDTLTVTVEEGAGNATVNGSTTDNAPNGSTTETGSSATDSSSADSNDDTDNVTDPNRTNQTAVSVDDPSVETTVDENGVIRINVSGADGGNAIGLDVPETAAMNRSAIELHQISLLSSRGGVFEISLAGGTTAPEGVPPVNRSRAVEPLAYWQLDHAVDANRPTGMTFVFGVDADRLDDASPDAVTLYRYHDGEWSAADTQLVGKTNGSYQFRVWSPAVSTFAVGVKQTEFTVLDATLHDGEVQRGETATVTATVENTGSTTVTRELTLRFGDQTAATKNVTVPPGERRTVTFAYEPVRTGEFVVRVAGLNAGMLQVEETATPTVADSMDNQASKWTLGSGIPLLVPVLLVVLLVGVGGLNYHRSRRESYPPVIEQLRKLF